MRTGDIVEVLFLDHVQDGDEPMPFRVYGRVVALNSRAVVVASWAHADKAHKSDHNTTTFTIVRSAIKEVHKLARVR